VRGRRDVRILISFFSKDIKSIAGKICIGSIRKNDTGRQKFNLQKQAGCTRQSICAVIGLQIIGGGHNV
jgi:hypothetical protein